MKREQRAEIVERVARQVYAGGGRDTVEEILTKSGFFDLLTAAEKVDKTEVSSKDLGVLVRSMKRGMWPIRERDLDGLRSAIRKARGD